MAKSGSDNGQGTGAAGAAAQAEAPAALAGRVQRREGGHDGPGPRAAQAGHSPQSCLSEAAPTPYILRRAHLEALGLDPELEFGVVRGAGLRAAEELDIRSYFCRVTVLLLPQFPN